MTKYFLFLFVVLAIGCKPDEDVPEVLVPVYFHVECAAKINSGSIWMNDQKIEFSDTGVYIMQEPQSTKYLYIQYSFLTSPANQDVKVTISANDWKMERHHQSNVGKSSIESLSLD